MTGPVWLLGLAVVPVDPDAEEARRLLLRELGKPEYQAARRKWIEDLTTAIRDWLDSLQSLAGDGASLLISALVVVALVLVLGVAIVAFLVIGIPRLNRHSAFDATLFGETDERDAATLRAAAARAAAAGDFATAIAESFRAIARGLAERGVLTTSPGTTASHFAEQAAALFPESAAALQLAARTFDEVRYLGETGTAEGYAGVAALQRELRTAHPARHEVTA